MPELLDPLAPNADMVISVRGLTKRYGQLVALDQLDLAGDATAGLATLARHCGGVDSVDES